MAAGYAAVMTTCFCYLLPPCRQMVTVSGVTDAVSALPAGVMVIQLQRDARPRLFNSLAAVE